MIDAGKHAAIQLPIETQEMYGAFSADRTRLLTGGDGAVPNVQIWDVKSRNCLNEIENDTIVLEGTSVHISTAYLKNRPSPSDPAYDQYIIQIRAALWQKECVLIAYRKPPDIQKSLIRRISLYSQQTGERIANYDFGVPRQPCE